MAKVNLELIMDWNTIRRETSLIEHVCEHGTGHPNYYSVARLHLYCANWVPGTEDEDYVEEFDHGFDTCSWWIHGCDGCCGRDDFPGRRMTNEQITLRLYDRCAQYMEGHINAQDLRDWCAFTVHDLNVNRTHGAS